MDNSNTEFPGTVPPTIKERPLPPEWTQNRRVKWGLVAALAGLLALVGIKDNFFNRKDSIGNSSTPAPTAPKSAQTSPDKTVNLFNPNGRYGQDPNDTPAQRVAQGKPVFPGNQPKQP